MGYTHIEIDCIQTAKRPGNPCGDLVRVERGPDSTYVICSDGLGSGVKANLAATLCVSRLMEMLRLGYSMREAFGDLVRTMNEARTTDMPYAVFTMMQFRSDGETTILSYEMPPPIYVCRNTASVLPQQTHVRDQAIIGESNCFVEPGEGILVVSDGITQAGMGCGLALGWTIEGVGEAVASYVSDGINLYDIPRRVHQEAREFWGTVAGDDCTALMATCRAGRVVNLFTGPPANRNRDAAVVNRFANTEGAKIVCGATTAKVVAAHTGKTVSVSQVGNSLIEPPRYEIDGIDLVTEGAVTLNQVYNLIDEDLDNCPDTSAVAELCRLLTSADRINFLVGQMHNEANGDLSFRQQGILPRATIVRLLTEKLRENGKLVVVDYAA